MDINEESYQDICQVVHKRRLRQIQLLPSATFKPITRTEEEILSCSISDIITKCSRGEITRDAIRQSYMKKVVDAQKEFNCVSEVLVLDEEEELQKQGEEVNETQRPLEGVPITLKDTIDVQGHHTTLGFAQNANNRVGSHSPLVQLLLDAGCILLAKSTVPTALFSISTQSPFFSGPTLNPHNPLYGVGASTGGGGALVASRSTLVEIGSDVAGSIRLPAHFTGVYGLKGSAGRWPSEGNQSSMEGIECLKTLGGPLTQRMGDMIDIWRGVINMKPWAYESSCLPIPWRESELKDVMGRKLKWGVVWTDGMIPPSPACRRALTMAIDSLRDEGHEVVDVTPYTPSIPELLAIGYQLAFGDGCSQILSQLQSTDEPLNLPLQAIIDMVRLPGWKRWLLTLLLKTLALLGAGVPAFDNTNTSNGPQATHQSWITRLLDSIFPRRHVGYAFYKDQLGLLSIVKPQTISSERALIESRNEHRRDWHDKVWKQHGLDFIITPAAPLPAFREETGPKRWPLGENSVGESKDEEPQGGWLARLLEWCWPRKKTKDVVGRGDPERAGLGVAGYTFLFNLLDYTAGVLPITTVDREVDALVPPHPEAPVHNVQPKGQVYEKTLPRSIYMRYSDGRVPLPDERYPQAYHEVSSPTSTSSTLVDVNADQLFDKLKSHSPSSSPLPYYATSCPSYTAYSVYDSIGMHGLPVGIQVVGKQLEEERVLGAMKVIDDVIRKAGWSIN